MGISPKDFEILAFVLSGGAATVKTLAGKFGKDDVIRLLDDGYLVRFGKRATHRRQPYVALTKLGKKTVTLGLVQ